MTGVSAASAELEMVRTQNKPNALPGFSYPMRLMRPPMGQLSREAPRGLRRAGCAHVVLRDVTDTDATQALKITQPGSKTVDGRPVLWYTQRGGQTVQPVPRIRPNGMKGCPA